MRDKYYNADIWDLDGTLFQSRETMIEHARDNWESFCSPIGEDAKLDNFLDEGSCLTFIFSSVDYDGGPREVDSVHVEYNVRELVWLVSDLERMVARV